MNKENGTILPVDQRRIVRALADKAAELRSDAARKISIAEIISDLIPRINTDGSWHNVRGVKLYEGEIYLIRRNYPDLPPSDPCVARWEAITGWREIVGHLPRPTNDALEVYCPNAIDRNAVDKVSIPVVLSGRDVAAKKAERPRLDGREPHPSNLAPETDLPLTWEEGYKLLWERKITLLKKDDRRISLPIRKNNPLTFLQK